MLGKGLGSIEPDSKRAFCNTKQKCEPRRTHRDQGDAATRNNFDIQAPGSFSENSHIKASKNALTVSNWRAPTWFNESGHPLAVSITFSLPPHVFRVVVTPAGAAASIPLEPYAQGPV